MARPSYENFVNFDRPDRKDEVWRFIGPLTGDYEVTIIPRRLSASQRQRAWYFAEVVRAFADFLAAQDYEDCDREHAHQLLKSKMLTVMVANKRNGEIIGFRVRSITELSIPEMTAYIDNCRDWLMGYFNIRTRTPEEWLAERQAANSGREFVEMLTKRNRKKQLEESR